MKERLSAVMDGEVDGPDCDGCLERLKSDPGLQEAWRIYHVIGDAIRGHAGTGLPAAFAGRLAAEPTVLAPRRPQRHGGRIAWYALSAAASVAGVALVAWMALPLVQPEVQMASSMPPIATVAEAQPVSVPLARGVNDYLLAHQRFSPSSALGGMAPYIRTVSESDGAR